MSIDRLNRLPDSVTALVFENLSAEDYHNFQRTCKLSSKIIKEDELIWKTFTSHRQRPLKLEHTIEKWSITSWREHYRADSFSYTVRIAVKKAENNDQLIDRIVVLVNTIGAGILFYDGITGALRVCPSFESLKERFSQGLISFDELAYTRPACLNAFQAMAFSQAWNFFVSMLGTAYNWHQSESSSFHIIRGRKIINCSLGVSQIIAGMYINSIHPKACGDLAILTGSSFVIQGLFPRQVKKAAILVGAVTVVAAKAFQSVRKGVAKRITSWTNALQHLSAIEYW